jgi:hypothetical protein
MKIYLQDCKTLKFLRCDSSWGSDLSEALDFISVRRASLYGQIELKEDFQLLQVEADGFQSRVSAIISRLPVIKTVTSARLVRSHRTSHVDREILERTGLWQNRRSAGQILPPLFARLGQLPRVVAIFNNVF